MTRRIAQHWCSDGMDGAWPCVSSSKFSGGHVPPSPSLRRYCLQSPYTCAQHRTCKLDFIFHTSLWSFSSNIRHWETFFIFSSIGASKQFCLAKTMGAQWQAVRKRCQPSRRIWCRFLANDLPNGLSEHRWADCQKPWRGGRTEENWAFLSSFCCRMVLAAHTTLLGWLFQQDSAAVRKEPHRDRQLASREKRGNTTRSGWLSRHTVRAIWFLLVQSSCLPPADWSWALYQLSTSHTSSSGHPNRHTCTAVAVQWKTRKNSS